MRDTLAPERLLARQDEDGFTAVVDLAHSGRLLFRVARMAGATIIEVRPRGIGRVRVDLGDVLADVLGVPT